ncbi:GntT/GntP/DsdX family permease [Zobellia nedashkovskayae]
MTSLLFLLLCIVLLIVAVTVFKVHPIPALLISGLILGLTTGSSVELVTDSLLSGFGNTLKWIGLIILFGTLLGEILAQTGGADVIANTIINLFGTKYLPLSMAVIGFLIGIPVFMDVAYLTLLPTIFVLSKKIWPFRSYSRTFFSY